MKIGEHMHPRSQVTPLVCLDALGDKVLQSPSIDIFLAGNPVVDGSSEWLGTASLVNDFGHLSIKNQDEIEALSPVRQGTSGFKPSVIRIVSDWKSPC